MLNSFFAGKKFAAFKVSDFGRLQNVAFAGQTFTRGCRRPRSITDAAKLRKTLCKQEFFAPAEKKFDVRFIGLGRMQTDSPHPGKLGNMALSAGIDLELR